MPSDYCLLRKLGAFRDVIEVILALHSSLAYEMPDSEMFIGDSRGHSHRCLFDRLNNKASRFSVSYKRGKYYTTKNAFYTSAERSSPVNTGSA